MGISFDLSVEDLPDDIFDVVVQGNYHKIDPFTISRWDGIEVTQGSWIINDIQIANNIVIVCGSYEALFDSAFTDPDVAQDALYNELVLPTLAWRDGFFAACNFDYLEKPEAWHLVPCRAALEFGPYMAQDPDNIDEGGLYSMCVDGRTLGQELGENWKDSFGNGVLPHAKGGFKGEDVYVTAVGYHSVKNMDLNDYLNAAPVTVANPQQYDPYHYSLFSNQDFYPCIYTFAITPFLDPTDPEELAKVREMEASGNYQEAGLRVELLPEYVQRLVGQDGETIDQLGRAVHLNGINDTGSPVGQFNEVEDYTAKIGRSYGLGVTPLEQYSYRCHTMGALNTPVTNNTWLDPYARAYSRNGYIPTSFMGQFPIMKPLEFAIGVPGTQVRDTDTEAFNLWTPESVRNPDSYDIVVDQVREHSDALLWRHGYIPRKFKTVFRAQPVSSPISSMDPTFPDNVVVPTEAAFLGTLIIGGDCLVQEYDAVRNRPVSGMAKTSGGELVYEPLLVYGMNGYSQIFMPIAGSQETNQNLGFGFFMGYTKRNMTVAQDISGAGVSSLDNASIEWIAPRQMTFPGLGVTTSFLLGFQITSPSERGEVYAFQPGLVNSQNYPQRFCQDWKVIGPYLTAAQDNLPVKIPVRWHGIASQPILDIGPPPSPSNGLSYFNNYKTYGFQTPEQTGEAVGRSIIMGGNGTDGTYATAYDYGSAYVDFNPVWNFRTFAPTDPETPAFDGFMQLKFSGLRGTNDGYTDSITQSGPGEIKFATPLKKTGDTPRYGSRLYHIPNDNMQYPNNVNSPAGGWDWLQNSTLSLNGFDITALNPGATIPLPSGLYESLDQLVDQLNDALTSQKSAGIPWSQDTPNGLGGITFKKTSDNKGVYSQVDNQFLDTDPTVYGGYLAIVDPTAGGGPGAWNDSNNYPYGQDLPGGTLPYIYEWFGPAMGGAGEPGAVTCEPLEVLVASGCFLDIAESIDNTIPDAVTDVTKRFFLTGDYDTDRDQWLLSISNIGANPEEGKYYVVAATTDYSEFLDQTDNFPLNSGNALLLALNQRTFKLDGAAFSGSFRGPLNLVATDDYPAHGVMPNLGTLYGYKISGTTGRDVKVFLNYMLYDGLDSLIAVEVANLGLRVTPENVLWYKTNILNQNADEEVTLEEIQNWMSMQREQYEEMLRNRKPVTRDQGSLPDVKDFVLDDESIEDLLPELTRLPPNPDSDPTDADMMGNTLSGDIQSVDEKRRETDV